MRAFVAVFALVLACGCAEQPEGGLDIPPELEELRDTALHCSRDVQFTPIEHSEHCVIVAETIFDQRRKECDRSRSYECMNWKRVKADIHVIYQSAVVESLFQHGRTDFFVDGDPEEWVKVLIFDGARMRSYFEKCLASEEEALAGNGLQKIHQVIERPLREGQMCFRKGYPSFETRPLDST